MTRLAAAVPWSALALAPSTRCLLLGLTLGAGAGCGLFDPSDSTPADIVQREWLTEDVAATLTPQGTFASVAQAEEYPEDLSLVEAEALGTLFVRTIPGRLGGLDAYIIEGHGAPVDFGSLRACGRSFYMRSSFHPLDPAIRADGLRSAIEARWLMTFCSAAGTPTVLQNLHAATHATAVNGRVVIPVEASGDFYNFGIPLTRPSLVRSPETAVARVYAVTRTRTSKVPEMLHDLTSSGPGHEYGRPFGPYWKIEVEHPVTVTTPAQESIQARVFYVLAYSVLFDDAVYVAGAVPLAPFRVPSHRSEGGDSILVSPREPLNYERVISDR